MEQKRIACMKCKHYFTSFDPKMPRGCRLYSFQSQIMPYVLVKQSTGQDCEHFEMNERLKENSKEDGKIDYNDPKYW